VYDVIECFPSARPKEQTKLLVFQSRYAEAATLHAQELWRVSDKAFGRSSTFIVIDRSTAREVCRVPAR